MAKKDLQEMLLIETAQGCLLRVESLVSVVFFAPLRFVLRSLRVALRLVSVVIDTASGTSQVQVLLHVRAVQRTPPRFGPGGARPPMGVPGAMPRSTSGAAFPLPPSGQKLVLRRPVSDT